MDAVYYIILLISIIGLGILLLRILVTLREVTTELQQLRREVNQSKDPLHSSRQTPLTVAPGTAPAFSDHSNMPAASEASVPPARTGRAAGTPQIKKGFFARNPDLEKFIGENLINKLGIAVLVLGIGFFVKYAIDQDWIPAGGRVLIGLGCGLGLLGVAHRLRAQYTAFSSVLVGGGLAVLYFTIALAFHQYHLFNQTMAFLLMVALTGFSVFMAQLYNRQELAVLALLGGFASPLLASSGGNNYIILFSYVLILNIGMLVLAYFKKWTSITVISYAATVILFAGWLFEKVIGEPQAPYLGGLVFAALFYLVFFAMTVVYNLKENRPFSLLEIGILLSNTTFFYIAALYLLDNLAGGAYQGIFSGGLAFFNGAVAWQLYQKTAVDRKLIYLLTFIALMLVYLAILLELTYRMGARTGEARAIKNLVIAGFHYAYAAIVLRFLPDRIQQRWPLVQVITGVSFISFAVLVHPVVRDARDAYLLQPATSILPFALHYLAVGLLLLVLYNCYSYYQRAYGLKAKPARWFIWLGCGALVFLASTELDHLLLLWNYAPGQNLAALLQQQHKIGFPILWGIASFIFMLSGMRYKLKTLRLVSLTLFFITLFKLFLFDIRNISAGGRIAAFISLGLLLLVVSFLYQKLKVLLLEDEPGAAENNG